jgi:spore coat polysaccharide biosynthesis protein SpsF (cytidylyltransferase family)
MKTVAIIQARMGSSRLPGKMLMPIFREMGALELMLVRLRKAATLDLLAVATTTDRQDAPLVDVCARLQVPCFRGQVEDVLDRFYQAARALGTPDVLVRLTGDCPLHDPAVLDKVVAHFRTRACDYASNVNPPTFPDGLDTEVFSAAALERTWREAKLPSEREHVTPYLRNHPERFRLSNVTHTTDLSPLRWTLDEERDLAFFRSVYEELGRTEFGLEDVLRVLAEAPSLQTLNAGIRRNEGLLKSLARDKATAC